MTTRCWPPPTGSTNSPAAGSLSAGLLLHDASTSPEEVGEEVAGAGASREVDCQLDEPADVGAQPTGLRMAPVDVPVPEPTCEDLCGPGRDGAMHELVVRLALRRVKFGREGARNQICERRLGSDDTDCGPDLRHECTVLGALDQRRPVEIGPPPEHHD